MNSQRLNGVPFLKMRSVGTARQEGRRKEIRKGRGKGGTFSPNKAVVSWISIDGAPETRNLKMN